jgi:hypothetical protein
VFWLSCHSFKVSVRKAKRISDEKYLLKKPSGPVFFRRIVDRKKNRAGVQKKAGRKQNYPGYMVLNRGLQGRDALPLLIYPAEKNWMRKIQVYSHHAMSAFHTPSGSSPLSNQTQTPFKPREGDNQLIFGRLKEAVASLVPAIRVI